MMDWNGSWGVGTWLVMSLTMGVIWGGAITFVVWLVRSGSGTSRFQITAVPRSGPEETLAERFARGEIDEDEFLRRIDLLQSLRGGS